MPISVVFDPPLPSDSPSTFNTKAFTLLGDLNDWSTQANALPGEVATNLSALLAAPPAIGSTTPAAGSFTSLSASGAVTIPGSITTNSDLSVVKTTVDDTGIVVRNPSASGSYPLGKVSQNGATGSGITSWPNAMVVEGQATGGLVLGGYVGDLVLQTGRADRMRIANATGAVTIPGSLSAGATSVTTLSASGPITLTAANPYISFVGTSATQNWRLGDGIGATNGNFVLYDYTSSVKAIEVTKGTGAVTIPGATSFTGGTFGYGTGAGGTVTQSTSKSTAVTLNKPCGQITMNNAALAANTFAVFQLSNSFIAATDIVNVCANINTSGAYEAWAYYVTSGLCLIAVRNNNSTSLSDAVVINFSVIKGAAS